MILLNRATTLLFGSEPPPQDRMQRQQAILPGTDDDPELDRLSKEFCQRNPVIHAFLDEYAVRHHLIDSFLAPF